MVARSLSIDGFLIRAGWIDAERVLLAGDASFHPARIKKPSIERDLATITQIP
jgi:hypothetical protein